MPGPVDCFRCNAVVERQPEPLDLSWAGGLGGPQGPPRESDDGPNAADVEFRGILVEVHRCPSCGGIAIRPAEIRLPEWNLRLARAV